MYSESQCQKGILCNFEKSRDLPDALIEVCVQCSKKVVYYKVAGEIDEKKYLRDHLRDTLQPYGRTAKLFREIYGTKNLRMFEKLSRGKKSKEELQKEWTETRKEANDYVNKRVLGAEGKRGTDWT